MRYKLVAWILFIVLSSSFTFAQLPTENYFPYKDMIFAQVATGDIYETLIMLNNRGTVQYAGTLNFYRGAGVAWNPIVNDTPVAGGQLAVTIAAGKTSSFRITGSGETESGYAIFKRANVDLTNYIEGNLTYFVKSGGQITDSIGVLPSTPFVLASLPFEDFSTILLAFANTDWAGRSATLTLRVYNENNAQVSTTYTKSLGNREHLAVYAPSLFNNVQLQRGRIEIQSDYYISGTAIMASAGGQYSSLPLGSTMRTYTVSSSGMGVVFAKITLWTNGVFVNGYVTVTRNASSELFLVYGQINTTGELHLHFDGKSEATNSMEIFGYIKVNGPFTWSATTFTGNYFIALPDIDESYVDGGSFTCTLVQ